jgi:hypothetical protein
MFGVEAPITCGGMTRVGKAELIAAVANAGALGFITAHSAGKPEDLARKCSAAATMTDKPFGVNLTILPSITPIPYDEYREAIIESGIKMVETAGNNPQPHLPRFKEAGVKVIHKCTSVRHAVKAQSHRRRLRLDRRAGMRRPSRRRRCRRPDPFPGDGRQAHHSDHRSAAAWRMRAGWWRRWRSAATASTWARASWRPRKRRSTSTSKKQIVANDERGTNLIFRTMHNTARVAKNAISDEVVAIERRGNAKFEDVKDLVAGTRGAGVLDKGEMDAGIWSAGQTQGLIHDIPSCAELVARIMREAEAIIRGRLNKPDQSAVMLGEEEGASDRLLSRWAARSVGPSE